MNPKALSKLSKEEISDLLFDSDFIGKRTYYNQVLVCYCNNGSYFDVFYDPEKNEIYKAEPRTLDEVIKHYSKDIEHPPLR